MADEGAGSRKGRRRKGKEERKELVAGKEGGEREKRKRRKGKEERKELVAGKEGGGKEEIRKGKMEGKKSRKRLLFRLIFSIFTK